MSYSVKYEDRGDYLYAYVTGEDSLEASLAYWREITDQTLKGKFNKLLVEEDMEGQLNDLDMFEFARQLVDMGLTEVRIAFVDRRMEHNEGNEFGELVATNRGIKGKVFTDTKEAETWLLE